MVLTALLIVGITVLVFIFLYFVPVNLWITARFSGVVIGLLELVFMRVRRVPPSIVVNSSPLKTLNPKDVPIQILPCLSSNTFLTTGEANPCSPLYNDISNKLPNRVWAITRNPNVTIVYFKQGFILRR